MHWLIILSLIRREETGENPSFSLFAEKNGSVWIVSIQIFIQDLQNNLKSLKDDLEET